MILLVLVQDVLVPGYDQYCNKIAHAHSIMGEKIEENWQHIQSIRQAGRLSDK